MAKTKKISAKAIEPNDPFIRRNRIAFMLNDKEFAVLKRFLSKYKVTNKSKFIREAVMKTVLRRLDEDYPTLFD